MSTTSTSTSTSSPTSKELIWLITGCTSGLGIDIVKEAVKRGDKVIATGRNVERIRSLEVEDKVKTLELDICQPAEYIEAVLQKALDIWGRIDVLVNNAGLGYIGPVECASEKDFRDLFEANLFGPWKLTKAILPRFRQRHQGTVMFVGSRSSQIPNPFIGVYGASKAGVSLMSEALAREVAPFGIRVLCFDPSSMTTPQYTKVPSHLYSAPSIKDYQPMADHFTEVMLRKWQEPQATSAGVAAVIADFAREEGCAFGQQQALPTRLPLGSEVRTQLQARLQETQKMLDQWQGTIDGVDGLK